MSESWLEPYLAAFPPGARLLELGCGPGEDAAALSALGFEVVASDLLESQLSQARAAFGTRALLWLDHGRGLPFIDDAFAGAVASLSLHYFPWKVTVATFAEVHRVLRPGAAFLFRVNATDDVEYGARDGVEVEPNLREYEPEGEIFAWRQYGRLKRFFDEAAVRDALAGEFVIESLRHVQVERWRKPKQTWECLARAR